MITVIPVVLSDGKFIEKSTLTLKEAVDFAQSKNNNGTIFKIDNKYLTTKELIDYDTTR